MSIIIPMPDSGIDQTHTEMQTPPSSSSSSSSSTTIEAANLIPPRLVLPWRTRLAVSFLSAITDFTLRPNGTLNRRLVNMLDLKCSPTGVAPSKRLPAVVSSDVTVDPSRDLWFRFYVPTTTNRESRPNCSNTAAPAEEGTTTAIKTTTLLPVFVFFHGGGFAYLSASSRSYDIVCQRFARRLPAVVVSVNYRLTPEHRFPCQYDDGFDVLQFLDHNINILTPPEQIGNGDGSSTSMEGMGVGVDLSKCFLCGDSAGANLAHHVAVRACRAQFRVLKVIGLVSIQPFFGGEERTQSEIRLWDYPLVTQARTDWLWKAFVPEHDRDHYAVNVSGPNAEDISGLKSFPETVVFVGGLDPLQDWQRRYYSWLKKNGKEVRLIEYPEMIHAFYVFPELPQSSHLFSQVKDFVALRLARLPL